MYDGNLRKIDFGQFKLSGVRAIGMDYSSLITYSMLVTAKLNRQLLVCGGKLPYYKVRQLFLLQSATSLLYPGCQRYCSLLSGWNLLCCGSSIRKTHKAFVELVPKQTNSLTKKQRKYYTRNRVLPSAALRSF